MVSTLLEHDTDRETGEGLSDGACGGLLVPRSSYIHASIRRAVSSYQPGLAQYLDKID
jgi:hypothetical protein